MTQHRVYVIYTAYDIVYITQHIWHSIYDIAQRQPDKPSRSFYFIFLFSVQGCLLLLINDIQYEIAYVLYACRRYTVCIVWVSIYCIYTLYTLYLCNVISIHYILYIYIYICTLYTIYIYTISYHVVYIYIYIPYLIMYYIYILYILYHIM